MQHLFTFLLFFLFSTLYAQSYYNIKDYGAIGNGETLDTRAIQKAIDSCHENGGGTVYMPAGSYLSGTLVFRDNITLFLDSGATLLGSTDLQDFPSMIPAFRSYTDVNYTEKSLIYAENVENIAIIGRGIIDGQGEEDAYQLKSGPANYKKRPYMIRMIECHNVLLRDVKIINSPMWVQHYLACENVNIDGITVHSNVNHNNDGIDIDCCNKVRISNCEINSGDDAIVLKATAPQDCENITITNCVLSSHCNAFKCGTESTGGFKNITFSNSTIYDTRLSGIALEMVDGGTMDRVVISGITMKDVKGGIFIRLGNRARPYLSTGAGGPSKQQYVPEAGLEKPPVGTLGNIIIRDVIATGISKVGCSITGIPARSAENITLENLQLSFVGGGGTDLVTWDVPEQIDRYPEHSMFGTLPAYGFYCRHVNNLKFRDIQLDYAGSEERPAMMFDDIDRLVLEDLDLKVPSSDYPSVRFRDVKNLEKK